MKEETKFKHEQLCDLCLNTMRQHTPGFPLTNIEYNNKQPGIIIQVHIKQPVFKKNYFNAFDIFLKQNALDMYFDVIKYNSSIHVNLKKEYYNKHEQLEVLFRMQGIL